MLFDNEKPRKGPSSTLISRPPVKLTTTKPKPKPDIIEPEIDIEAVPVLHGSFEVTKTDADITEKKVRTSTLKPFTITNGAVRMKPKKTTIEKVRPLPKVPENLTANILKLENVTKPFHYERVTTSKTPTSTEEILATTTESEIQHTSTQSTITTTKKLSNTNSFTWSSTESSHIASSTTVESSTQSTIVITPSEPPPTVKSVSIFTPLEGEVLSQNNSPKKEQTANVFPSTIVLDDQPWQPIQPNLKPLNYSLNDARKKINNPIEQPQSTAQSENDQDLVGFQLLPRNKLRNPIGAVMKTKTPTIYHGYNNPGLMYGLHEVERLGNGPVKPYPLPVDLIGDQMNYKKDEFTLNKGEILPIEKDSLLKSTEATLHQVSSTLTPSNNTDEHIKEEITLNMEETTEKMKNKTEWSSEESGPQVGEILLDLLKESNVKLNDSDSGDLTMESRLDDLEIPAQKQLEQQNRTDNFNETDISDHTEALDEIATVLSSIETLSFKNIKDYIMATTKSFAKEALIPTTERDQTIARKGEVPTSQLDAMIKSDRIALPAPIPSTNREQSTASSPTTTILNIIPKSSSTTQSSFSFDDVDTESESATTTSYVEIDTVEYTPGTSWSEALFPVQSKWEYINGSIVYPSIAPMKKIYNETLQAWIIENPVESTEHIPVELIRNNTEPLKNISAIFDTLASSLGINSRAPTKLPGFTTNPTPNKYTNTNSQQTSPSELFSSSTIFMKSTQATAAPISIPAKSIDDELPILLNQNTESYYGSSSETLLGQAEIEEIDPTQYEQMLLVDRVSSALRPTSTLPSLVTLMPVKSNSGLRNTFNNNKIKSSARLFPPSSLSSSSSSSSSKRRFEDTSFVVRTNINVGS